MDVHLVHGRFILIGDFNWSVKGAVLRQNVGSGSSWVVLGSRCSGGVRVSKSAWGEISDDAEEVKFGFCFSWYMNYQMFLFK